MPLPPVDTDRIARALPALPYLARQRDGACGAAWRVSGIYDLSALERIHENGLIRDPAGKATPVMPTDDGVRRYEEVFARFFARSS